MTSTKMKFAGAAVALAFAAGLPLAAHAQTAQYDGYCYAKKDDAKATGTVVGAIIGGALGSQVSKNERGLGTVGGAVIGGAIGRNVGANSVKCQNGEYYSYQSGYYDPSPAPDGYQVVYYKSRPDTNTYQTVYYDTARHTSPQVAYNGDRDRGYNNAGNSGNSSYTPASATQGWRDTDGAWHSGRPVAFGWKDTRGRWHEGQLAAYGWEDTGGTWHETSTAPSYGYNNGSGNGSGYNNNGNNNNYNNGGY